MSERSYTESKYSFLPCPFCGHKPYVAADMGGAVIRCENHDCFGPRTTAQYLVDALKQWNARAPAKGSSGGGGLAEIVKREAEEWLATGLIDESDKRAVTSFANWLMKVACDAPRASGCTAPNYRNALVLLERGFIDLDSNARLAWKKEVGKFLAAIATDAAYALPSTMRRAACQCCGETKDLKCGPSKFGAETWACADCWEPEGAMAPK